MATRPVQSGVNTSGQLSVSEIDKLGKDYGFTVKVITEKRGLIGIVSALFREKGLRIEGDDGKQYLVKSTFTSDKSLVTEYKKGKEAFLNATAFLTGKASLNDTTALQILRQNLKVNSTLRQKAAQQLLGDNDLITHVINNKTGRRIEITKDKEGVITVRHFTSWQDKGSPEQLGENVSVPVFQLLGHKTDPKKIFKAMAGAMDELVQYKKGKIVNLYIGAEDIVVKGDVATIKQNQGVDVLTSTIGSQKFELKKAKPFVQQEVGQYIELRKKAQEAKISGGGGAETANQNAMNCAEKIEVMQMGIVFAEILFHEDFQKVYVKDREIDHQKLNEAIEKKLADRPDMQALLKGMLAKNPEERFTAEQAQDAYKKAAETL